MEDKPALHASVDLNQEDWEQDAIDPIEISTVEKDKPIAGTCQSVNVVQKPFNIGPVHNSVHLTPISINQKPSDIEQGSSDICLQPPNIQQEPIDTEPFYKIQNNSDTNQEPPNVNHDSSYHEQNIDQEPTIIKQNPSYKIQNNSDTNQEPSNVDHDSSYHEQNIDQEPTIIKQNPSYSIENSSYNIPKPSYNKQNLTDTDQRPTSISEYPSYSEQNLTDTDQGPTSIGEYPSYSDQNLSDTDQGPTSIGEHPLNSEQNLSDTDRNPTNIKEINSDRNLENSELSSLNSESPTGANSHQSTKSLKTTKKVPISVDKSTQGAKPKNKQNKENKTLHPEKGKKKYTKKKSRVYHNSYYHGSFGQPQRDFQQHNYYAPNGFDYPLRNDGMYEMMLNRNGQNLDYYNSDLESETTAPLYGFRGNCASSGATTASLDGLTSVSRQWEENALTPSQLAKSLSELPEFEASLLSLIDQFEFDHQKVRQIVIANGNVFDLEGEAVRLRPKINLCQNHLKDNDGCSDRNACQDLHLCLQFVTGFCTDKTCIYGHFIHTNHNRPILNNFHLNFLSANLVLSLLKISNLPFSNENLKLCEDYNQGKCLESNCTDLHLCIENLAKCCLLKDKCILNHNISAKQISSVLDLHGICSNESPKDILLAVLKCRHIKERVKALTPSSGSLAKPISVSDTASKTSVTDKSNASNSKPVQPPQQQPKSSTVWFYDYPGDVTINEICFNSVESSCPYEKSGCWRLHCTFHFYWQVRATNMQWVNLCGDQVHALEKAYCDPSTDGIMLPPLDPANLKLSMTDSLSQHLLSTLQGRSKWKADFGTMQLTLPGQTNVLELRRLCSEYVANKSVAPCTFKWYFYDKKKNWIEYGAVDSTGDAKLKCNLTSKALEKQFRSLPTSSLKFSNLSFSYVINLGKMRQVNLSTKVSRKVRRRPVPHLK